MPNAPQQQTKVRAFLNARTFFVVIVCCLCVNIFFSLWTTQAATISSAVDSRSYRDYIQGLLFDQTGDFDQAKDAYRKALQYDYQSWQTHYRLGLDYLRLKDFESAEKELKIVAQLRPHDERVRFVLALAYSFHSKFDLAIKEYTALLAKPLVELDERTLRYSLAQLYFLKKDFKSAEILYRDLVTKFPQDSYAHFYLGYIFTETKNTTGAIEEFKSAIAINPNNPLALNSLSYVYAENGIQLEDALALAKKALTFEPDNGAFLDTLGWVYFKQKDFENALRYLKNASVVYENAEVFEHLGDVYAVTGNHDDARKNWQKSLELEPKRKQVKEKIENLKQETSR